MATKIIDAVKQAELKAQQAEKQASLQCEQILQDARRQAEQETNAMLQKAKREAQTMVDEAKRQSNGMEQGTQSTIASQIESMRQKALGRQDKAVQLILSELI